MKTFLFLILLSFSLQARAAKEPVVFDYAFEHGLMHGGAGGLIVMGEDFLLRFDRERDKHHLRNFLIETGTAFFFGYMKELDDRAGGGLFNPQQVLATTIGGAMVSASINF